jgi:ribonuclease HI
MTGFHDKNTPPVTQTITRQNEVTSWIKSDTIGNQSLLLDELQKGNISIVSDGSHKDPFGAGAWIITSPSLYPAHYITGSIQSPGKPLDQDSHRAEAIAIFGALETLSSLIDSVSSPNPLGVLYACDNTSALKYAFDIEQYPCITSHTPDYDIFTAIRSRLSNLHSTHFTWKHVKGHQNKYIGPLSFLATLNVHADRIANAARETFTECFPLFALPADNYFVTLDDNRIGKNFASQLYEHASRTNMQKFWKKKRSIDTPVFDIVDWTAIQKAASTSNNMTVRWINKHSTGICGTNDNLLLWKQRNDNFCPRCGSPETASHVWQCQGKGADKLWTQSLQDLDKWLHDHNTAPELHTALLSNLRYWITATPHPHPRSYLETTQDLIGWDYVLEGVFTLDWARLQQCHLASIGKSSTGHSWLVKLIKRLWQIAWTLWEHRNNAASLSNTKRKHEELTSTLLQELDSTNPLTAPLLNLPNDLGTKLHDLSIDTKHAWIDHIRAHKKLRLSDPSLRQEIRLMKGVMTRFLQK